MSTPLPGLGHQERSYLLPTAPSGPSSGGPDPWCVSPFPSHLPRVLCLKLFLWLSGSGVVFPVLEAFRKASGKSWLLALGVSPEEGLGDACELQPDPQYREARPGLL